MERKRPHFYAQDDNEVILRCPRCNGTNLHQLDVRVYQRYGFEDGPGMRAEMHGGEATVNHLEEQFLPGRRETVEIDFYCEGCYGGTEEIGTLSIKQHKGETNLFWTPLPGESD